MKYVAYLLFLAIITLTSVCHSTEIRFSDQITLGAPDQDARYSRAIRAFGAQDDGHLIAWISLDPAPLELILNPELLSDSQLVKQQQLIERVFDQISRELIMRGHMVLPKNGKIIRGASMYAKIDKRAFQRLMRISLISDIYLIYGKSEE